MTRFEKIKKIIAEMDAKRMAQELGNPLSEVLYPDTTAPWCTYYNCRRIDGGCEKCRLEWLMQEVIEE